MEKENGSIRFPGVQDGETFFVNGTEFIKFPDAGGVTPAVARSCVFNSRFGENNNLAESAIMKRLQEEFLPGIIEAVGADSLCPIKTDLTTLDGLKPYEDMESLISLPTFDFYRANVGIFDKYSADRWWWLATPESAHPHDSPDWALCVSPSGYIFRLGNVYFGRGGVRPFLLFASSIFESSEK